jgi:hypothetical protein
MLRRSKPLSFAVAGTIGLAAAGPSQAVHLSQNGAGQVLIFPHYTVRSNAASTYNTLIAVTNTSGDVKFAKVRFFEGRNGSEVMDFNLILDANDIWTAAVVPTDAGARIVTNDNTCVTPGDIFTSPNKGDFRNTAYIGDGGGSSPDRTREGYFEIIEMAIATEGLVVTYAKHGPNGLQSCAALDEMDPGATGNRPKFISSHFGPPSGGLMGRASIIDPASGANFTYDATALDGWSDKAQYSGIGSPLPKLGSASPAGSNTLMSNGDGLRAVWENGRDAVSAVLMRDSIANEFILDSGTLSKTDWVVAFPTKREYIGPGVIAAPFERNSAYPADYCDVVLAETNDASNRGGSVFSSTASAIKPTGFERDLPSPLPFCSTSGITAFQSTSLLASRNSLPLPGNLQLFVSGATTAAGIRTSVPSGTVQGPNGRMRVNFKLPTQRLTALSATLNGQPSALKTFVGLPLISFGVHNYGRTGVVSNYGGLIPSTYTTSVTN